MRGISWPAENRFASQGLCSMQYLCKYYEEIGRQDGNTQIFGDNYLGHKYVKNRQLAEQMFQAYK
jgi:hypothetical protein